jgi:catechol-2,3-dioxygenase
MEHIIGQLLQDYEHGKMTRRQLIRTLALTATAASTVRSAEAAAPANAIYINHVSMQVTDYQKTRDFYSGLFGMKVTNDDGKTQCRLTFGDNILIGSQRRQPAWRQSRGRSHCLHAGQLGHGQDSQTDGRSGAEATRVEDTSD